MVLWESKVDIVLSVSECVNILWPKFVESILMISSFIHYIDYAALEMEHGDNIME